MPRPRPSLRGLRSRFLDSRTLEVWGRTDAPDGTTIRLSIEAAGRRFRLADVPAAQGRFYTREALPAGTRGQSLRIAARIVG